MAITGVFFTQISLEIYQNDCLDEINRSRGSIWTLIDITYFLRANYVSLIFWLFWLFSISLTKWENFFSCSYGCFSTHWHVLILYMHFKKKFPVGFLRYGCLNIDLFDFSDFFQNFHFSKIVCYMCPECPQKLSRKLYHVETIILIYSLTIFRQKMATKHKKIFLQKIRYMRIFSIFQYHLQSGKIFLAVFMGGFQLNGIC